jgi:hypothetical protein
MSYSRVSREIKAGTLLISSQTTNSAPHAWYGMDQELGVKPASWTFINPLGQTTLTPAMAARWGAGPVGRSLGKRDAGYWEVDLVNTSDAALSQFDILLLPLNNALRLTTIERERMRRFMDQGGILWVDVTSLAPAIDEANNLPVPVSTVANGGAIDANLAHPLLTTPNSVSLDELTSLRSGFGVLVAPISGAPLGLTSFLNGIASESLRLEGATGNGSGFALATARVGDGALVASSLRLSQLVSRSSTGGTNFGFSSTSIAVDGFYFSAAKLVANIVGLGTAYSSPGGGSRRTGSIRGDVPAPLLKRFAAGGSFGQGSTAAHVGGTIVVTEGSTITAYDAEPERDINGDGNPDDGIPNATGAANDVLWTFTAGSDVSSPVIAEVATSSDPQQVWVVSREGEAICISLLTGNVLATIAGPGNTDTSRPPLAPTVHEGLLLVTDTVSTGFGRVRIIDLATQTALVNAGNAFALNGTSRLDLPTASASVGYVPIFDNSGGLDRVVYVATKGGSTSAGLTSLWVGAKGESPSRIFRSGNDITISTRAGLQGLPVFVPNGESAFGFRLTLLEPSTGRPLSASEIQSNITGGATAGITPGDVRLTLSGSARTDWDWDGQNTPGNVTDDVGWRVDYTIDWSRSQINNPTADSYVRGNVLLPDNSDNLRVIVGSPAITSRGNVLVAQTNFAPGRTAPDINNGGTTVYNFREEGRGDFSLVSRFDLFDSVRIVYNNGQTLGYRETIVDEDQLLNQPPLGFLRQNITDLRAISAPSVSGDTAFLTASGFKAVGPFQVPTTVVVALEAHPDPVQFLVHGLTNDAQNPYTLIQADPVRSTSTNRTTPEQTSVLPQASFLVEPTGDPNLSKVTIKNLMSVPRGQMRDAISTSLPVILRRTNGDTDIVIEPEAATGNGVLQPGTASGRFTPVRWFYVGNGFRAGAGPMIAGRTMYVGGASVLPNFTISGLANLTERGLLYGLDTEVASNDEFLSANSVKPWLNQLNTVKANSGTPWDVRPANALRWPQPQGIRNFSDFRVRLLQNTLNPAQVVGLSAGDGTLAAFDGSSVTVFSQAEFSVVDSQRVSRFDSAGNPLWVLQSTTQNGSEINSSPAQRGNVLVDPSRVYPDGNDTAWVVDPGSNRIVLVDRAGQEVRSMRRIRLHPNRVIPELPAGAPTELSSPRDIQVFSRIYSAAQVQNAFPGEVREFTGPELWRHVLIADAGNRRAVEVVDRFRVNAQGRVLGVVRYQVGGEWVPAYGVALWHSPEEISGPGFAYNSIGRVINPSNPAASITAFGFNSSQPSRGTVGLDSPNAASSGATGFGGIVLFDSRRSESLVITEFAVPEVPDNAYLVERAGRYYFESRGSAAGNKRINGLTSITLRRAVVGGRSRLVVMLTDSDGVFELMQPDPVADPSQWAVVWMLPKRAYLGMRRNTLVDPVSGYAPVDISANPAGFQPMYAKRLDSGEVLVVNSYVGTFFGAGGAPFQGEVILLDGRAGSPDVPGFNLSLANLGFNSLSVRFELPPVAGIRDIVRPVFAERR